MNAVADESETTSVNWIVLVGEGSFHYRLISWQLFVYHVTTISPTVDFFLALESEMVCQKDLDEEYLSDIKEGAEAITFKE